MAQKVFTHEDYVKERESLSKYEQANYDSYEKTILTLAAAFLAFSVSFLGLIKKTPAPGVPPIALTSPNLLVFSWISFASSILCMLVCFLINALAFRAETVKIESALENVAALESNNPCSRIGFVLYFASGIAFLLGLTLLLIFCARNIQLF